MATSSFYHNIVIDTDEKAIHLTKALDASVAWNKAHPEACKKNDDVTVVEDEAAIKSLLKTLMV